MFTYNNKYLENKQLKKKIEQLNEQIKELQNEVRGWKEETFKTRRELELLKPIEQRSDIELAHLSLHIPLNDAWSSLWRMVNNEIDKRYSAYIENKDKV